MLSEEQIQQLVAYIKSLSAAPAGAAPGSAAGGRTMTPVQRR